MKEQILDDKEEEGTARVVRVDFKRPLQLVDRLQGGERETTGYEPDERETTGYEPTSSIACSIFFVTLQHRVE